MAGISIIAGTSAVQAQGSKLLQNETSPQTFSAERLNLWSTDVNFNLFGNDFNTFKLTELNLRRYFNDQTAMRLSLEFGLDNDKNTANYDNENPKLDKEKTYTTTHKETLTTSSKKTFGIGIGYEHHADIFDKVDMFYGAELGYSGTFYSAQIQTDINGIEQDVYSYSYYRNEYSESSVKKYFKSDDNGNSNSHVLFAGAFVGADIFIYKNIYLGTEFGVKYKYSISTNGYYTEAEKNVSKEFLGEGKNSIKSTVTTTEEKEFSSKDGIGKVTVKTDPSSSNSTTDYYSPISSDRTVTGTLGLYIDPSFHIGIRF